MTGDDLEGLTFAAEPDEALSGWTVVVSAGREGDAYAGALDVTASATPSETAVTLTVTDRNGKPWSATTPTLTAVQAPVTAIDLSRDGTANCYIVSEAGEYMFDATVRGNGSGDDAAIALADGMKADWLWVTKGLEQEISAVSLDAGKGRIFFTAAGAAKGNAVIALADAAGEIVWSWHLWFTPEPRMVTYANGRVLLDRSLGAVGTTPGSAEAYGLYYQWGRKDPFIGPSTYKISSGQGAAMYNDSGSRTYVTMVASSAETGTMDYAVKHPLAFVTGVTESNNDWLWSKSDAGWSSDGDAGAKSVNDPCPYGWRVAPSAAFAGLEIVGTPAAGDEEKFGWTLTDGKAESFFMGGGRRRYDDGKIQNIYIPKDEAKMKLYTRADIAQPWEGLYWTTAVDGTQSNALHFWYEKLTGTGGIAPAEAYARANGMQVRCVKVKNL